MTGLNANEAYWFARGYYDGRVYGNEESLIDYVVNQTDGDPKVRIINDEARSAYRQGYDAGVADYCEMDIDGEGEA